MTIGKGVLIASIALFATVVLSGCVSATNPDTGEKNWKFAPTEAVKTAVVAVKEMPDETKASIFEGLGWLFGFFGAGAAATPICSKVANYYRNRGKTKDKVAATQQEEKKDVA